MPFTPGFSAPIFSDVDDRARREALNQTLWLNGHDDDSFKRITRLAARLCSVPIVLVSLGDQSRQRLISGMGLPASDEPGKDLSRAQAFFDSAPLEVGDALTDSRFASHPWVAGDPHARSFLVFPILGADGAQIGIVCAMDIKPHSFTSAEVDALADCAKLIQALVQERERAAQALDRETKTARRSAMFCKTFELAQVGIIHTSLSGAPMMVNPRALELLGYSLDELLATTFIEITHPSDVAANVEFFLQMASGEIDSYRMEKRFKRGDGEYLWCNLAVNMVFDDSGSPDYILSVIEDLSDKKSTLESLGKEKRALEDAAAEHVRSLNSTGQSMMESMKKLLASEKRHREMERRVRMITNNIPGMVGYWTAGLVCEFANESYKLCFGSPSEKILGMTMLALMGPELFALNEPHVRAALRGEPQHFTRRLVDSDGEVTFTDARYVPEWGERGAVAGFYVLVIDMTELHTAREELEAINLKLAQETATDHLTEISNRRGFSRACSEASEQSASSGTSPGLILLDLDDFKRVNDSFGHNAGDDALRAVGRALRDHLRNHNDMPARLGGEEFAMLCVDVPDLATLGAIAERIRKKIERIEVKCEKGTIGLTASFGVALSECSPPDWKDMYRQADKAVYEAKAAGKNRVGGIANPILAEPEQDLLHKNS